MLAYIGDILIIEPTRTQCKATFDTLLNLQVRVSQFTLKWTKVVYPAHCLIFLELKSTLFTVSSTSKKIMCLSCYPFSGEQAQNVNLPSFTSNDCLASLNGQHILFKGAAHFLDILLP